MDIRMPHMDGIEATKTIRAAHPDTEVVILTTFDEDGYALDAVPVPHIMGVSPGD